MTIEQVRAILAKRGSPMVGELGGIAAAAKRHNVPLAYVLGIAGAESEFGTTGYARGRHNPYGYGIHSGLDYPTYTKATEAMLKGITSSTYRGQKTIRGIANIYAPSSENDTVRYAQNVARIASMFGGQYNPQSQVIGGGVQPTGVANMAPKVNSAGIAQNSTGLDSKLGRLQVLSALMGMSSKDKPTQLSSLLTLRNLKQGGGAGTFAPQETSQAPQNTQDISDLPTKGGMPGGLGGDWGDSMQLALAVARASGLPITSQKRSRKMTASGGVSDHWTGSTQSYAVDLGTSGAAGDRAYERVMNYLSRQAGTPSIKRLTSGTWRNFNIGPHRYQVGWETPGHFDHIHVGVERQ